MTLDVKKIREDFPILKRKVHDDKPLIYFDNTATSQKPKAVIDVLVEFYTKHNANIHRGIHVLSEESTEMYEHSKTLVKEFINADSEEEIIYTRNTTESINLLASSLGKSLKEGDEVIVSLMEHHSNIVPWQFLQEKGVKLKFVNVTEDYTLDIEHLEELITNKTKIVSLVHVSNVLGTINPIKEIGKIVHDHGAIFIVDGAQSAPHLKVDVKDLDVDFYAFSSHKMLGPTGIGVLYGKKHLLEELPPYMGGGDMIKTVHKYEATWNDLPWKFEAGTTNIADGIAFGEAIKYLQKIGMDNVRKHEIELTEYALKRLEEIETIKHHGPSDVKIKGGVIAYSMENVHPHDMATILDYEHGIAIRAGQHCAQPLHKEILGVDATSRASFYIYNTKEEVDVFIEALKEINAVFNE